MSRVLSNNPKSNLRLPTKSPKNRKNGGVGLVVDPESAGQRLDNFLLAKIKGVPKSLIYRLVRQGKIKVDDQKKEVSSRITSGARVTLPESLRSAHSQSPLTLQNSSSSLHKPPLKLQKLLLDNILLENANFIILNKPSGIAVHGGSGVSFGVIEIMRSIKPAWQKLELAHRLDRDSSGCLLLAKKRRVIAAFQRAAAAGRTTKYYLLLVPGQFPTAPQTVDLPLRKNVLKSGERMVVVDHVLGKPSSTCFHLVEQFKDCALIGAVLQSGRTHQIRVHAASIGFPLAGDEKYGDAAFNTAMRQLGLKRLFLHAHTLKINWLTDDNLEAVSVQAALEEDLRRLLATIRLASYQQKLSIEE